MKIGAGIVLAVALFVAGVAVVLLQLWVDWIDAAMFWKIEITLGALLVIVVVVLYAVKEYREYKSMTRDQ
jgi:hypothetical protein